MSSETNNPSGILIVVTQIVIIGKMVVLLCTKYVRGKNIKDKLCFDALTLLVVSTETNGPSYKILIMGRMMINNNRKDSCVVMHTMVVFFTALLGPV